MGESARIHDVETLKLARAALSQFGEEIRTSLASIDSDIQRMSQWLSADRPNHWKLEIRHRETKLERIKAEIMRKRIVAAPEPASTVLEERQADRIHLRIEEARRRLAATRRWAPVWDREAMLYKSSTRGLSEALHGDIPRAIAILGKMMESLEDYAAIAPPAGEPDAPMPAGERSRQLPESLRNPESGGENDDQEQGQEQEHNPEQYREQGGSTGGSKPAPEQQP